MYNHNINPDKAIMRPSFLNQREKKQIPGRVRDEMKDPKEFLTNFKVEIYNDDHKF